ncbi:MAG: hypothetical protein ACXWUG_14100 [Polyangiales bacterium]
MRALLLSLVFAIVACGGGSPPAAPKQSKWKGALLYYPFEPNSQWSFRVSGPPGLPTLLKIDKVIAFDGQIAIVQSGAESRTYKIAPDGIVRDPSGAYLLKYPMKLGDKWPGAKGATVVVTRVDAKVTVPAGTYEGCVETTETIQGDEAGLVRTVFCPEVGPVEAEVRELNPPPGEVAQFAVQRLLSYGMPATLGEKTGETSPATGK